MKGLKIKIKGPNLFQIQIFDNLLPKLFQILKIEGPNAESRRRRPDGRTRGGHAKNEEEKLKEGETGEEAS